MALTAAEKKELDELEAELGSTPVNKLSADEEKELNELEAEFGNTPATSKVSNIPAVERKELSGGEAALALSSKMAFGAGPILAGAAAATAGYLSEGGSLSEMKAIYDMGVDDYNNNMAQAERQFPTLAKVTDFASFIQKAVPSSQVANFGISIAEQVGQDGLNLDAVGKGAGLAAAGALGGRALQPVVKGAAVMGKRIADGLEQLPAYISKWGEAVDLSSAMEKIGVISSGAKIVLFNTLSNRGLDVDSFVKKISEYEVNGAPIFTGTIINMKKGIEEKTGQLGKELGDLMIDINASVMPGIPASNFNRSMSSIMDMLADTPVPKDLSVIENLQNKMLFMQEKGVVDLKDVHNFKQYVNKAINWEDLTSAKVNAQYERLYFESSDFLKSIIDDAKVAPEIKSIYAAASEEYGNLMQLKRVIANEPGIEFDKLAKMTELSKGIKRFLSSSAQDVSAILSSSILEPMQKVGLSKVLTAFSGGMDTIAPYITKITEGLARDPNILNDLLAPAESAVDLTLQPVQRNTDSMLQKDTQIYNLLRESDPVLAAKFNLAINEEQYDVLGELMSSLSNLPKFRKFIEPGLGWDGKVTNETEKEIVRGRILGANLSVIQQMTQIENLDKSGIIPADEPKNELRQLARKPMRDAAGKKKEEY